MAAASRQRRADPEENVEPDAGLRTFQRRVEVGVDEDSKYSRQEPRSDRGVGIPDPSGTAADPPGETQAPDEPQ